MLKPYLTTPTHDDIDAVIASYGPISDRLPGQIVYGFTTSSGMIVLIVSMVGGVLVTVLSMLAGIDGGAAVWVGLLGGVIVLAALIAYTAGVIARGQKAFTVNFPSPMLEPEADVESSAEG